MDPTSVRRVHEAVGGQWLPGGEPPAAEVLVVSTDSRAIGAGTLFAALPGTRVDGRKFIREAVARGAVAVLAAPGPPEDVQGLPVLEVPDVLEALERLAAWVRDSSGAERFAITGTVGKTTVKEFLATLLARRHAVVRAPKSFNNLLGVSLTLLQARRDTRFIVCETGASAPGELSRLSRLVRPHRAIVTEIGQAHLAGFGDLDGVVRAKSEIFEGLLSGGTAFINEGTAGRDRLAAAARSAGGRVVLFGWDRGDYRVTACRRLQGAEAGIGSDRVSENLPAAGARRPSGTEEREATCCSTGFLFQVRDPSGREVELTLPVPGRHNVLNALAAAAAALDTGLAWEEVREGLRSLRLPPLRMDLRRIAGVTVIDDTYNASIRSVQAALGEAGEIPLPPGGRRFLVLGDLLELGGKSAGIHREIGREVARSGAFAGIISVGAESRCAAEAASGEGVSASFRAESLERVEDVAGRLEGLLEPGDLVLFKASRGIALDRAAEALRRLLGARQGPTAEAGGKDTEAGRIGACCSTSII